MLFMKHAPLSIHAGKYFGSGQGNTAYVSKGYEVGSLPPYLNPIHADSTQQSSRGTDKINVKSHSAYSEVMLTGVSNWS